MRRLATAVREYAYRRELAAKVARVPMVVAQRKRVPPELIESGAAQLDRLASRKP